MAEQLTPDAVAALAEAFKAYWSDPDMEQEDDPEWYARQLLANLPEGWSLVQRQSMVAALEALEDLERHHRMDSYGMRGDCEMANESAINAVYAARAAIEGGR